MCSGSITITADWSDRCVAVSRYYCRCRKLDNINSITVCLFCTRGVHAAATPESKQAFTYVGGGRRGVFRVLVFCFLLFSSSDHHEQVL